MVKRPSRWHQIYRSPSKNMLLQARELQKFIQTLNHKNIFILSHSAGSIIASLLAEEPSIEKIICFGYPFKHPNKAEEPYRTHHLSSIKKPLLIIQGLQDEYGGKDIQTHYELSRCISIIFTDDNHDYNQMSDEDYEEILWRVRSFIEDLD